MRLPCHRGDMFPPPRWRLASTAVTLSRHRGGSYISKARSEKIFSFIGIFTTYHFLFCSACFVFVFVFVIVFISFHRHAVALTASTTLSPLRSNFHRNHRLLYQLQVIVAAHALHSARPKIKLFYSLKTPCAWRNPLFGGEVRQCAWLQTSSGSYIAPTTCFSISLPMLRM